MSATRLRLPKYRHYRPKNLAVVRIDGHDHYLGTYDSRESREKYHRLLATWLAGSNGTLSRNSNGQADPPPTVNHVLLSFWRFAESYYGATNKELACLRDVLRPVRKLYGQTPAGEFGPRSLKIVRDHMIDEQDLCRNSWP